MLPGHLCHIWQCRTCAREIWVPRHASYLGTFCRLIIHLKNQIWHELLLFSLNQYFWRVKYFFCKVFILFMQRDYLTCCTTHVRFLGINMTHAVSLCILTASSDQTTPWQHKLGRQKLLACEAFLPAVGKFLPANWSDFQDHAIILPAGIWLPAEWSDSRAWYSWHPCFDSW